MRLSSIKSWIPLALIVVLATLLRLYSLGTLPPALTWDEAAWGYNGYALVLRGTDEFGKVTPVAYFESFGDFKPPVYAYLVSVAVKILGLNEFSTRAPSAVAGVITVFITYFLVLRIFPEGKAKRAYALAAAFFLAISPWHINLSRAAFEANVSTMFIVAGVWFFLKAVDTRKLYLVFSGICFVLSMYTFNSARVVVPLLVLALTFFFRDSLRKNIPAVLIAGVISLMLLLPTIPFLISPQASLRFKEVNIFSDISIVEKANLNQERSQDFIGDLVNNRRVLYAREYLKHYFDNLTPNFLFVKGDGNPKFSSQTVGQLYLWDIPFLFIGIFLLFRKKEGRWYLLPVWILLGIIPAATARETPHALRIETIIPTFQIIVAYGFVQALSFVRLKYRKGLIYPMFIAISSLLLLINVIYYIHDYYAHYGRIYSGEWQYGYKDMVSFVSEEKDKYDTVYITDKLGRPYIYFLFYEKRDPQDFQLSASVEREVLGFVNVRGFDKYQFLRDLPHDLTDKNILFVNTPDSVPDGATIVKRFPLLNGNDSLVAYTL